jgi:hypothetical protein
MQISRGDAVTPHPIGLRFTMSLAEDYAMCTEVYSVLKTEKMF